MAQRKLTSTAILSMLLSGIAYAHSIPADVKQFEKTGTCVNCDLSGVALRTSQPGALNLQGSNLIKSWSDFLVSNRQYSNFSNVVAVQLYMSYGDFSYSKFTNADLRNAKLHDSNMTGADFTGANVTGVNFSNANLYKALISKDQLKSVSSLCNAILPDGTDAGCN